MSRARAARSRQVGIRIIRLVPAMRASCRRNPQTALSNGLRVKGKLWGLFGGRFTDRSRHLPSLLELKIREAALYDDQTANEGAEYNGIQNCSSRGVHDVTDEETSGYSVSNQTRRDRGHSGNEEDGHPEIRVCATE
jgi:hypothetical protein